jgi:hypothetical protein
MELGRWSGARYCEPSVEGVLHAPSESAAEAAIVGSNILLTTRAENFILME